MATIYDLKPRFQSALRPLVVRFHDAGATANQVTVAAALLSLLYGALIAATGGVTIVLLGLPIVLFVRMGLNAIDGMLAREHGQESRPGFFLNEIGDVVSDAALYLPLALVVAPGHPLLAGAMVVVFALGEFAGVLGLASGSGRRYDGPFGKSDRAAFFSVLAVLFALFALPAWLAPGLLWLAFVLGCLTVANRVRRALAGGASDG